MPKSKRTDAIQAKEVVERVLREAKGDNFSISGVICRAIENTVEESQHEVFRYACETFGTLSSSEQYEIEPSPYLASKERLEEMYGNVVNSLIESLQKQGLSEEDYYRELWSLFNSGILFEDEEKREFAVYYTLIDARIPYFKIDSDKLCSMSNEDIRSLIDDHPEVFQRVRFLVTANFSQRTERASALLAELGINMPSSGALEDEMDEYRRKLLVMLVLMIELGRRPDESIVRKIVERAEQL